MEKSKGVCAKKRLLALAAAGAAAAGAGVIQGMAQVITVTDPGVFPGLTYACVATAGESCSSDEVAVSNGGNAQGPDAISNGGSAQGGELALAVNGPACGEGIAGGNAVISVGGSGASNCPYWSDGVALATQGNSQACTDGNLFGPWAWWSVAVNLTGNAAVYCNWGSPDGNGGIGAAVAPLGTATMCGIGVAVSVTGAANGGCTQDTAGVSGLGAASGGAAAVSGGSDSTDTATASDPDSVAVAGGKGDANAGMAAISMEGNARACGGAVTIAFVPGQVANQGGSASVCPGTLPVP